MAIASHMKAPDESLYGFSKVGGKLFWSE